MHLALSLERARRGALTLASVTLPWLAASAAWADEAAEAPKVADPGDTAWVLASSALVLMMTLPGLALFYGGLVRSKNVLNVFMQCFIARGRGRRCSGCSAATASRSAAAAARSSATSRKAGLAGVDLTSVVANYGTDPAAPHPGVSSSSCSRACSRSSRPALILGAVVERMKFSAFLVFISRLAAARLLPARVHGLGRRLDLPGRRDRLRGRPGRPHVERLLGARRRAHARQARRGFGKEPMPPHSLPLCLIGAGLLWAGWFGFNAGSAPQRERRSPRSRSSTPRTAASTAIVRLGADRVAAPRQADRARRRDRGRRGPRRDHARLRQRVADGRDRGRRSASRSSATSRVTFLKPALRLRRLARRVRRPRDRRHLGRAGVRHLRHDARRRHREQRGAGDGAAQVDRLHRGLRPGR